MFIGVVFALAAGLMWGLIFVGPLLVPDYPAALQSTGRYLAFGLITLPLAWFDRRRLRKLRRQDWLEALKLTAIGNLLYYLCRQRHSAYRRTGIDHDHRYPAGGDRPLRQSFYGRHDGRLAWGKLAPALLLIVCGLACVNVAELRGNALPIDGWRYLSGLGLAVLAVACWTGSRCATRAGCGRTRRSGRPPATAQGW